jgi:hypothetical protein
MAKLTKKEKLQRCAGCEDDFYNGNNNLGVKECWRLKDAKLIKRKQVHIDQVPPWNQEPIETLDCYRVKKCVFVDAKRTH